MSDDLIRRFDAIEAIRKLPNAGIRWTISAELAFDALLNVPSADRPSGEWLKFGLGRGTRILFCTNCERRIEVPLSQSDSNYNFCPNCGARMKGANDE